MMVDVKTPLDREKLKAKAKKANLKVVQPTKEQIEAEQKKEEDNNFERVSPYDSEFRPPQDRVDQRDGFYKTVTVYPYLDRDGVPFNYIVRWDWKDAKGDPNKDIHPFTFGRLRKDKDSEWQKPKWHCKNIGGIASRIPYNLDQITKRPDATVLIVEGEKTVDAAKEHYKNSKYFSDLVVTTSQNGSSSPQLTDWSYLKGRKVIICPDNDKAGFKYAYTIYDLLCIAGAYSVEIVNIKNWFTQKGKDLADPLPIALRVSEEEKQALYDALLQDTTELIVSKPIEVKRFKNGKDALFFLKETEKDGIKSIPVTSTNIYIKSFFDDGNGKEDAGLIFSLFNRNGRYVEICLLNKSMASLVKFKEDLLPKAVPVIDWKLLEIYLTTANNDGDNIMILAKKSGLYKDKDGQYCFVLLNKFRYGSKQFTFQADYENNLFQKKGCCYSWIESVGKYLGGNSRLCLACCASFASVFYEFMKWETKIFHFIGSSSSGKTTALKVALSIWGEYESQLLTWQTSPTALENRAVEMNNTCLFLDELSQADPEKLRGVSYMLSQGKGNDRGRPDRAGNRERLIFKNISLSTGEEDQETIFKKIKVDVKTGELLRFLNIEADAGAGLGIFDVLPNKYHKGSYVGLRDDEKASAYSDDLIKAINENYGVIGVAFIKRFVDEINNRGDSFKREIEAKVNQGVKDFLCTLDISSGQIIRVAKDFVRMGIVGEYATEWGFTGWEAGDATNSARRCFENWLAKWGTFGSREELTILESIKATIQRDKAQFSELTSLKDNYTSFSELTPPRDKKGSYYKNADQEEVYVFTGAELLEMSPNKNINVIITALKTKRCLLKGEVGKTAKKLYINKNRYSCYVITSKLFEEE